MMHFSVMCATIYIYAHEHCSPNSSLSYFSFSNIDFFTMIKIVTCLLDLHLLCQLISYLSVCGLYEVFFQILLFVVQIYEC